MKHKTIAQVAVLMLVVYGLTVLLYPTLFNPDKKGNEPAVAPPVTTTQVPNK